MDDDLGLGTGPGLAADISSGDDAATGAAPRHPAEAELTVVSPLATGLGLTGEKYPTVMVASTDSHKETDVQREKEDAFLLRAEWKKVGGRAAQEAALEAFLKWARFATVRGLEVLGMGSVLDPVTPRFRGPAWVRSGAIEYMHWHRDGEVTRLLRRRQGLGEEDMEAAEGGEAHGGPAEEGVLFELNGREDVRVMLLYLGKAIAANYPAMTERLLDRSPKSWLVRLPRGVQTAQELEEWLEAHPTSAPRRVPGWNRGAGETIAEEEAEGPMGDDDDDDDDDVDGEDGQEAFGIHNVHAALARQIQTARREQTQLSGGERGIDPGKESDSEDDEEDADGPAPGMGDGLAPLTGGGGPGQNEEGGAAASGAAAASGGNGDGDEDDDDDDDDDGEGSGGLRTNDVTGVARGGGAPGGRRRRKVLPLGGVVSAPRAAAAKKSPRWKTLGPCVRPVRTVGEAQLVARCVVELAARSGWGALLHFLLFCRKEHAFTQRLMARAVLEHPYLGREIPVLMVTALCLDGGASRVAPGVSRAIRLAAALSRGAAPPADAPPALLEAAQAWMDGLSAVELAQLAQFVEGAGPGVNSRALASE